MSQPAASSACSEAFQPGIWLEAMPPTPMMPTFKVFAMRTPYLQRGRETRTSTAFGRVDGVCVWVMAGAGRPISGVWKIIYNSVPVQRYVRRRNRGKKQIAGELGREALGEDGFEPCWLCGRGAIKGMASTLRLRECHRTFEKPLKTVRMFTMLCCMEKL